MTNQPIISYSQKVTILSDVIGFVSVLEANYYPCTTEQDVGVVHAHLSQYRFAVHTVLLEIAFFLN